jgi:hypothetical protein
VRNTDALVALRRIVSYGRGESRRGRWRYGASIALAVGLTLGLAPISNADVNLGSAGGITYVQDAAEPGPPPADGVLVECPGARRVAGGGFSQSGLLTGLLNDATPADDADSDRDADDAWTIEMTGFHEQLRALAICAKGELAYAVGRVTVDAGQTRAATAACPHDMHVTGGGASLRGISPDSHLTATHPLDDRDRGKAPDDGWRARAHNSGDVRRVMLVRAICANDPPVYLEEGVVLEPGSGKAARANCPSDAHLLGVGGRLDGLGSEAFLTVAMADDDGDGDSVPDDRAVVGGTNAIGAAGDKELTAYAICARR